LRKIASTQTTTRARIGALQSDSRRNAVNPAGPLADPRLRRTRMQAPAKITPAVRTVLNVFRGMLRTSSSVNAIIRTATPSR
jgi:hypothetical protein